MLPMNFLSYDEISKDLFINLMEVLYGFLRPI